jgi:hypothetical protein
LVVKLLLTVLADLLQLNVGKICIVDFFVLFLESVEYVFKVFIFLLFFDFFRGNLLVQRFGHGLIFLLFIVDQDQRVIGNVDGQMADFPKFLILFDRSLGSIFAGLHLLLQISFDDGIVSGVL